VDHGEDLVAAPDHAAGGTAAASLDADDAGAYLLDDGSQLLGQLDGQ
jgi:hypothetical protein